LRTTRNQPSIKMPGVARVNEDVVLTASFGAIFVAYRRLLERDELWLNKINVFPVPDGDTGTNLLRTVSAVVDRIAKADMEPGAQAAAAQEGALLGARGHGGIALCLIVRGFVEGALIEAQTDASRLVHALSEASHRAHRGFPRPVNGTILSVAAAAASAGDACGGSLLDVAAAARAAAAEALARTPHENPMLRDAGVVDAGGAGYVLFLEAIGEVLLSGTR
jgi:dihydroxyacetone kinase-like predicted kinase